MPRIRKIRKGSRPNSSPSRRHTAATCLHGLDRVGVDVPLWVFHTEMLELVGPLGKAWRGPEVLEVSHVLR